VPDSIPACEKPGGCPIYDLARDPILEEFCTDFMTAKALYRKTEDPRTQAYIFEKWGLYDSPRTLLALETVIAEWMQKNASTK
jgi:hypothetical protein